MPARVAVELDIFSGMPNPAWLLAPDQVSAFLDRLAAAPPSSAAQEPAGNLGYRGFIVEVTQDADTRSVRVQKGVIHMAQAGRTVFARDENRALERWLLQTGRPHIDPDILQVVERELR